MVFKINLEKKKEFIMFNFKESIKHIFPMCSIMIVLMEILMGLVFFNKVGNSGIFSIKLLVICTLLSLILILICFFIGAVIGSSKLETWELTVEENYAVLKNAMAVTTVNFADFKKFKKSKDSIVFYFKGLRRFYINWNCFHDSENLRNCLETVASRIGTFKKDDAPEEAAKTKAKFKSKYRIVFYVLITIIAIYELIRTIKKI